MSDLSFNRTERLLGPEAFDRLRNTRVAVFGLGGVGSWCVEALARSGVMNMTLIDADTVARSNINRQLPALTSTIGRPKVDVMKERILAINPRAEVLTLPIRFTDQTPFPFEDYDVVIDAIDSVADKAALLIKATSLKHLSVFSSMGAALRLDPTKITVAEFSKVTGDALAAALRRRFKRIGSFPPRKFRCVYSTEQIHHNHPVPEDSSGAMTFDKVAVANGAICPVTASFGLTLASLVINQIKI